MMSRPTITAYLLFAAMLTAQLAAAQGSPNIVINGDFDSDLSGWNVIDPSTLGITGTLTVTHDPAGDGVGLPSSGAMRLTWNLQDPTGTAIALTVVQSPCLEPTVASTTYRFGAMYNYLTSPTGGARFFPAVSNGPGCAAAPPPQIVPFPVMTLGSWETVETVLSTGSSIGGVRVLLEFTFVSDGMGGRISQGDLLVDRIFGRENPPLQALQAVASLDSTSGLTAFFSGEAIDGISPYPARFQWDFGDGETSSEQSPAHTYQTAGTYTVMLTVDTGFEQATNSLFVEVDDATIQEIPTLSTIGLFALVILLVGLALALLRKQRARKVTP